MNRFLIIATGYNCQQYVRGCIDSVLKGTMHHPLKLVCIDDGSTDGTAYMLKKAQAEMPVENLCNDRFAYEVYKDNEGACKRRYDAIKRHGRQGDIVVLLGLDDELMHAALWRIRVEYQRGVFMTYGNWQNQHGDGLPANFALDFDQATHDARSYRKATYRSTAPNTFYKFLFDAIPKEDFFYQGDWFKTTTESELMLSCLEMSGQARIGVIKEPIYLYRQNLPNNSQRRYGQEYKNKVYADVAARKPKQLYEDCIKCMP